jgi:hypothetical protein
MVQQIERLDADLYLYNQWDDSWWAGPSTKHVLSSWMRPHCFHLSSSQILSILQVVEFSFLHFRNNWQFGQESFRLTTAGLFVEVVGKSQRNESRSRDWFTLGH